MCRSPVKAPRGAGAGGSGAKRKKGADENGPAAKKARTTQAGAKKKPAKRKSKKGKLCASPERFYAFVLDCFM